MSEDFWYRRDPTKALRGMAQLSLELRGAYSTIIDLIYQNGGPIHDNPVWLSSALMISKRKWGSIREELLSMGRIKLAEDGRISDDECERVIAERVVERERLAEQGRVGGRKSAENRTKTPRKSSENSAKTLRNNFENEAEPSETNALVEARLAFGFKPNGKQLELEQELEEEGGGRRAMRAPDHADLPPDVLVEVVVPSLDHPSPDGRSLRDLGTALCAAAGPGLADPTKCWTLHTTVPRIGVAMKAGCDFDLDILPIVQALTAKPRPDPITTWVYFEQAWARARELRLRPMPEIQPGAQSHDLVRRSDQSTRNNPRAQRETRHRAALSVLEELGYVGLEPRTAAG